MNDSPRWHLDGLPGTTGIVEVMLYDDHLAAVAAARAEAVKDYKRNLGESTPPVGYHSQRCLNCDHIRATHTLTATGCLGHAVPGRIGSDCPCSEFMDVELTTRGKEGNVEKDEWECAVCGDTILPGEWFSHHQRLNVNVCSECPLTKVMGEDITTHSVLWGPRPAIGHDRLCSTQPGRHDPDDPATIRCECSILQQARAEGRLSGAVGFGRAEYDNGFNDAVEAVLKTVDSLEGSSFWRDDVVDAISGLVRERPLMSHRERAEPMKPQPRFMARGKRATVADIQRWRHTHLMGPVTCEIVADSDGGLVTYADHLAAIVAVPSDYQLGYADGLAEARDAVEQAKDEFVHATDAAKGDFALLVYDDTLRAIDGVQP